ncbi:MAG TPA: amphi-Trp domain-containing protein [Solirubrobacterales bacterium]|jgi:amphi-Trp domain-containing protein|nr:amphi-Trp domain-containing protein [Solirubrobacterales bacterium]HEX2467375.1 amphi-Trp domain-containing protein [Solirubrobacterales bacterium]
MRDFKHEERERLSSQQAAERLTDVAFALTTGGTLKLDGEEVALPDELVLERKARSKSDRVELEFELSWPATSAASPAPRQAISGE